MLRNAVSWPPLMWKFVNQLDTGLRRYNAAGVGWAKLHLPTRIGGQMKLCPPYSIFDLKMD